MSEQLCRVVDGGEACSDELAENWHWLKDDLATLYDYGVLVPVADGALLIEDDETIRFLCRHIRASLATCAVPPVEVPPMDLEAAVRSALRAAVGEQPERKRTT